MRDKGVARFSFRGEGGHIAKPNQFTLPPLSLSPFLPSPSFIISPLYLFSLPECMLATPLLDTDAQDVLELIGSKRLERVVQGKAKIDLILKD